MLLSAGLRPFTSAFYLRSPGQRRRGPISPPSSPAADLLGGRCSTGFPRDTQVAGYSVSMTSFRGPADSLVTLSSKSPALMVT